MSPKPVFYWWKLYLHEWRWSSFGVHCVAKPSMDPPKRRQRYPRNYAPHGRQKYFSIVGDWSKYRAHVWEDYSIKLFLITDRGLNFHLLRYALAPPIYPPPSPLGVRNNASLAGYISLGPRQAMKISGTGEGLAIERGRVAKYLRFIYFFQIEQKKT